MRLLDRYLLRELLVPLGYCLAGFLLFWVSFDLLAELSVFQERNISAAGIARYYLLKTPELLVMVTPIALLLGLLYSLTNHARNYELTAIRAAGVSLGRLALPYFGVGAVFSLGLFVVNEVWVPDNHAAARLLKAKPGKDGVSEKHWARNLHFRNSRDGRIWNIGAFNTVTFEMRNPQVEWKLLDRSTRLIARSAIRTNDCWTFLDVQEIVTFNDNEQAFPETRTNSLTVCEFTETPEQIRSEIKISRLTNFRTAKDVQLSIAEILAYLRLHPDINPRDRALLHTKLHERFAAPATCLVVVVIALPFGALSSRRNTFAGVAASVFICFAFFVLLRLGLAMGFGGYLPPLIAAWLPNALFAAVGAWMISKVP